MRKLILFLGLGLFCSITYAQDPHFSQYYASQSTVNPANTGMFDGDVRVSGLYRQQWPQFGSAFVTGTIAMEFKPEGFKDGQSPNRFAFGGMLMFDKTPDGVLKSQYAYATIAYHKALDEEGHSRLGMGFMAGYNQKILDASQLTFGNQFQSGGFNRGSGEAIGSGKLASFDVHAGMLYSYQDEDKLYYAGASIYHILNPKDYFLKQNEELNTVTRRWNLNAGLNIGTDNLHYAASALFMHQQKSNEILIGGTVGVPFGENGILYAGSWYRVGESFIPTVNLQWNTMNVGVSYDTYMSSQNTITKPKSVELSLAWRFAPYHDYKTGCFAF
jgi:type IX secretion system PorP/SprF family membrane protein